MKFPVLQSVECAILHNEFQPIDGKIIFTAVQQLAEQLGLGNNCQPMVTSTQKDVHVIVGNYRVLISQNPQPLGMEGFQSALTTPFTGMVFPDARNAVEQHKANTFITIGKGVVEMPVEVLETSIGDLVGDLTAFTSIDEAGRAMKLCQELVTLIISHHPSSAIHWCTSDNLIPETFFKSVTESDMQNMLYYRPFITSSAGRLDEGLPVGMVANGSQWLIGKMVEFQEASVPLSWMLETLHSFVKVCQIRGAIIPHMESFSLEGQDWRIGVIHEKIEGHDAWGKVRLKLLHAPQFGIYAENTATRTFEYQSKEEMQARVEVEQRELRAANDVLPGQTNVVDPQSTSNNVAVSAITASDSIERQEPNTTNEVVANLRQQLMQNSGTVETTNSPSGVIHTIKRRLLSAVRK